MSLSKTDKGRHALADRSLGLSPRERQALVLCDGRRPHRELAQLLGEQGPALVQRLLDDGYVQLITPAPAPPARTSRSSRAADEELDRPRARSSPSVDASSGPSTSSPGSSTGGSASQRSLAGAKMYLIDMLQLVREPEASAQAVGLHMAADEAQLVAAMSEAMAFIESSCGDSYTQRVAERLVRILPPEHEGVLSGLSLAQPSSGSAS
jgi:hypothetical protein